MVLIIWGLRGFSLLTTGLVFISKWHYWIAAALHTADDVFLKLFFIYFYLRWWLGLSRESRAENWFLTIHDSPPLSPVSPTLQQITLKALSDSSSQYTPYKQPLFLQKAPFCPAAGSKGARLSPKTSRSSQTLPEDLWRQWDGRQGGSGAPCAGAEKRLEVFNTLSCLIFCSKRKRFLGRNGLLNVCTAIRELGLWLCH